MMLALGQGQGQARGRGRNLPPAPPPVSDPPFVPPPPPVCDPSSGPMVSCLPGQNPAWRQLECQWTCEGIAIDPATLVPMNAVPATLDEEPASFVPFDELPATLPEEGRGLEESAVEQAFAGQESVSLPGSAQYGVETAQKATLTVGVLYALAKFLFV